MKLFLFKKKSDGFAKDKKAGAIDPLDTEKTAGIWQPSHSLSNISQGKKLNY